MDSCRLDQIRQRALDCDEHCQMAAKEKHPATCSACKQCGCGMEEKSTKGS